jgi:potassium-transporting ATPase potassium-binding subunit
MTAIGWLQILLVLALVLVCVVPLGAHMARVYSGEKTFLSPVFGPLERGFLRLAGASALRPQSWLGYTLAMLVFNAGGFLLLYAVQRFQGVLPLNPQGFDNVDPALAFNTAVSFVTNTNWQAYGGETTMSHFTQMAGLTVQNFLSAATGMALAAAMIRAFAKTGREGLGNFWVDLTRSTL